MHSKKIIPLLLCAFGILLCFGMVQGQSLAFSRVILMPNNSIDTIPANHVWKIESYSAEGEIMGGNASRPMAIRLNGATHFLGFNTRDGNGVQYDQGGGGTPFWLPEGTIVDVFDVGSGVKALSIIEFTVVP